MSYKGKKILAIVPARGGSKGILKKNLIKLSGLSLIAHSAKICNKIDWIDHSIISSDDKKMIDEGKKFGLKSLFVRPKKLSSDTAKAIDVWRHAFLEAEKYYNTTFHLTLLIEPSSPLRKKSHIKNSIKKIVDGRFDSLLTINKIDSKYHPDKLLKIQEDNLKYFSENGERITARQQLNSLYQRNGVCYILTRECLINQNKIIGKNCSYIIIDDFVVNIDNSFDYKIAQSIFKDTYE